MRKRKRTDTIAMNRPARKAALPARPIPRIHARLARIRVAFAVINRELFEVEQFELRKLTAGDVRRAASLATRLSFVPVWLDRSAGYARCLADRSRDVLGAIPATTTKLPHGRFRVFDGGRA